MKTSLLITDVNFWQKSSGSRSRIAALIGFLSQKLNLTVVYTGPARLPQSEYFSDPFELIILDEETILSSEEYGRLLKKKLKNRKFDAVIIEYIHSSYFINYLNISDECKIILDMHDLISERTSEFKKFNYNDTIFELDEANEYEILGLYDYVIAICRPDHLAVSRVIGRNKSLLCPHPCVVKPHNIRETVSTIAFVASSYLPNQDGLSHFLELCWPEISNRYELKLIIAGSVCSTLKDHPLPSNISLLGFVPDLEIIYGQTDIIINPVRFGAGIKIKNIEALANGIPLVTTSHGARGLEKGVSKAFLIGDDPRAFSEAIIELIDSFERRKDMGKEAVNYISQDFSADQCFNTLMDAIES